MSRIARCWLDARQRGLLWNTALLGVGTALLATAIGAPLGLALARIDLPRKGASAHRAGRARRCCLRMSWRSPGRIWQRRGSRNVPGATCLGVDLQPAGRRRRVEPGVLSRCRCWRRKWRSAESTDVSRKPRCSSRRRYACLRRITLPLAAPSVLAAALVIFVLAGLGVRRPRAAARPRLHDGGLHRIRGALRLQPRPVLAGRAAAGAVSASSRSPLSSSRRASGDDAARFRNASGIACSVADDQPR